MLHFTRLFALLIMVSHAAGQTTWHVDAANCPDPGDGSPANPFCSIQDAIDAAASGDTIEVASGTYEEIIDLGGKSLVLLGNVDDAPFPTTINGGFDTGNTVTISGGVGNETVLDGFTLDGDETGLRIIDSSPIIRNCTIRSHANGVVSTNGSPIFEACRILNNEGFLCAGVISDGGNPLFENCVIAWNISLAAGSPEAAAGALFVNNGDATLINCTLHQNSTQGSVFTESGGIINAGGGHLTVRNSILHNDEQSDVEILDDGTGSFDVRYSNVEDGLAGAGNIDAPPKFVSPGAFSYDFRLSCFSPCIDAGDNDAAAGLTGDFNGDPRFVNDANVVDTGNPGAAGPPVVDMGALERQHDSGIVPVSPGESIQAAMDFVCSGAEVVLEPGTYTQTIDFKGKALTVRSTDPTDPDVVASTIIDGNGALHVVQCRSGEGPDSVLDGLTITGGNANGLELSGGGMFVESSNPTVRRCAFIDNHASFSGGGIYVGHGSITLAECVFEGNSAVGGAGAVHIKVHPGPDGVFETSDDEAASMVALDCTFVGNSAAVAGALRGGVLDMTNCRFYGNSATDGAGAINCVYSVSEGICRNCIFSHNTAPEGSVLFNSGPDFVITSCTVNPASSDAIVNDSFSTGSVTVDNTISWFSCGDDPHFVDADGVDDIPGTLDDDLRLDLGSPCLNAGNNELVPPELTTDILGRPRIVNSTVDNGAYEAWYDSATGVVEEEVELLLFQDGGDRAQFAMLKMMNISGGIDASVSGIVFEQPVHFDTGGHAVLDITMRTATSLATGEFWLQPTMPFTQADLDDVGISSPFDLDLVEYDSGSDAWVLAGELNADPLGVRHEVTDTTSPAPPPPGSIGTYGDYGVFWNPDIGRGYVWANLDHAGDFAVGYAACYADLNTDNEVNVLDLIDLLGAWGPNPGHAADLNGDDVVNVFDLTELLSAWGPCS